MKKKHFKVDLIRNHKIKVRIIIFVLKIILNKYQAIINRFLQSMFMCSSFHIIFYNSSSK